MVTTYNNNCFVVNHPLVQHKLTLMRRKDASTNTFRRLLRELASLMAYYWNEPPPKPAGQAAVALLAAPVRG